MSHVIPGGGNTGACREVLPIVSDRSDAVPDARPAHLILVEQPGVKREIPQPSAVSGMIEAEQAMHRHGLHLREIKVVSRHKAIARGKSASWAGSGSPDHLRVLPPGQRQSRAFRRLRPVDGHCRLFGGGGQAARATVGP